MLYRIKCPGGEEEVRGRFWLSVTPGIRVDELSINTKDLRQSSRLRGRKSNTRPSEYTVWVIITNFDDPPPPHPGLVLTFPVNRLFLSTARRSYCFLSSFVVHERNSQHSYKQKSHFMWLLPWAVNCVVERVSGGSAVQETICAVWDSPESA
jgi:hypothetical protein